MILGPYIMLFLSLAGFELKQDSENVIVSVPYINTVDQMGDRHTDHGIIIIVVE